MTAYIQLQACLQAEPHTWLVTGVAGYIGNNLLEALFKLNQRVVGLDSLTRQFFGRIAEQVMAKPATQFA